MIQDDISYYAMHTNFDAAPGCMADLAAKKLGRTDCEVLEKMGETGDGTSYGIGCTGRFEQPMTLRAAAEQVKEKAATRSGEKIDEPVSSSVCRW